MSDKYFYDTHCHVFNLSHPNLLLFIKRFATEKNIGFITRIILISFFLIFSIAPIFYLNEILAFMNILFYRVLAYIFLGISILVVLFLLAPSLIVKYVFMKVPFIRRSVNLLSVMENNLGDYLLMMEKDIVDVQNGGHITVENKDYEKVVITPLMMDFGNKWLTDMYETIHYNELSTKPIVDQVIDLFNGIKEYTRRTSKNRLLIFPFLGINTQNYDWYNETTVTVREKINLFPPDIDRKLTTRMKGYGTENIINQLRRKVDWVKTDYRNVNKLRFRGKMSEEEKIILSSLFKDEKDKDKIDDLYKKSQRTGIPYVVDKNEYEKEMKEKIDMIFSQKKMPPDLKKNKKTIYTILRRYKLDKEDQKYYLMKKLYGTERIIFKQILAEIGYTKTTVKVLLDKYFGEFRNNNGRNRLANLEKRMGSFNGNIDDPAVNYNYFFAGIKVYPALGFDPWPEDKIEKRKVKYLYSVCSKKNIPIISHGSLGGFQVINKKTSIEYTFNKWNPVIAEFSALKLNIAHFGAFHYKWAKKIFHLMKSGKNVYTDFSCNCNKKKDYRKLEKLINKLCKSEKEKDKDNIYRKMLFGSDFMINLLWSDSYKEYLEFFIKTGKFEGRKNKFCHKNPHTFLFG